MLLGLRNADEALESMQKLVTHILELGSIIREAMDKDSNSLSRGRKDLWLACLDGIEFRPSLLKWHRIVKRVKKDMDVQCGDEARTWRTWENFLGLE